MALKYMANTGKVEKHGKLMRMLMVEVVEAIMMGTLKLASGEVNQVLRRKRGTRGSIHSKHMVRLRQCLRQ
jgi:hypothetical protein